ncbi:MAG: nitrile hydratase accessory protein [Gammaproteobacteria bacterium]|nr:nitrile hydratase accessory protein [Gammaproteobacteria bacterium]
MARLCSQAPWQSRAFGMARTLCEKGLYDWDEFREYLISEIDARDRTHPASDEYEYFDRFLVALTKLLADKGICETGELDLRAEEFADRPHGHDH